MSNSSETTPTPKLSELDLRIGQTVQLITRGPQPRKYYTQLIGYVEREFIMVRVPQENGWAVPFNAGESLDVRVFCGVSLYEFVCRLQTVLHHPRNFMLLTCPDSIRQTRFRSHERAKCALPVQILQGPSGPAPAGDFQFHDLSGSGAALVGPVALGEPGQPLQLQLAFDLAATGTHERLELSAEIQTVQPLRNANGQTSGFHHGIRFAHVEPRILLLVNELQRPQSY
jgi:c-di-GMP-binding flagellar brake protein YcgR